MTISIKDKFWLHTTQITVAIVAATGGVFGAYLAASSGASKAPVQSQPSAQFQLWSPAALTDSVDFIPIYRINKKTGEAWVHDLTEDHSKNEWRLITGGSSPPPIVQPQVMTPQDGG